jgi:hypothetical protein
MKRNFHKWGSAWGILLHLLRNASWDGAQVKAARDSEPGRA